MMSRVKVPVTDDRFGITDVGQRHGGSRGSSTKDPSGRLPRHPTRSGYRTNIALLFLGTPFECSKHRTSGFPFIIRQLRLLPFLPFHSPFNFPRVTTTARISVPPHNGVNSRLYRRSIDARVLIIAMEERARVPLLAL